MKQAVKNSTLNKALKNAKAKAAPKLDPLMGGSNGGSPKDRMIAGHFTKDVKDAMAMVQIKADKNLQQCMGEAFNLVCAKYGVPEAYTD